MNALIIASTLMLTQLATPQSSTYEITTLKFGNKTTYTFSFSRAVESDNVIIYNISNKACNLHKHKYDGVIETLTYNSDVFDDAGKYITFKINKKKRLCFMFVQKELLRPQKKTNSARHHRNITTATNIFVTVLNQVFLKTPTKRYRRIKRRPHHRQRKKTSHRRYR